LSTIREQREERLRSLFVSGRADGGEVYQEFLSNFAEIARGIAATRISDLQEREDVVQEILLSVHEARFSYQEDKPLLPWLYAITRFRIIDWLRKSKKRSVLSEFTDELGAVSESTAEDAMVLEKVLEQLPQKQREILSFVKIEDHSIRETAKKFSMSEGAVKVTVHRAMNTLKRAFGK